MRLITSWCALLGSLFLVAACKGVDCPAIIAPAILVTVRDSVTSLPAAHGARGAVRDGAYVDSLRLAGWDGPPSIDTELLLGAAIDRPGTYSVTIEKAGYQTWQRTGVAVGSSACGTDQVPLLARLVPLP
jgi:hypothetical protein